MDKENVMYINGILFRHKKGNPDICDNTDGPWEHYVKWNKSKKDKYCTRSHYMWNLKKQTQ